MFPGGPESFIFKHFPLQSHISTGPLLTLLGFQFSTPWRNSHSECHISEIKAWMNSLLLSVHGVANGHELYNTLNVLISLHESSLNWNNSAVCGIESITSDAEIDVDEVFWVLVEEIFHAESIIAWLISTFSRSHSASQNSPNNDKNILVFSVAANVSFNVLN